MRAGFSRAERLRDPAHGSYGPLPAPQGPGVARGAHGGAWDERVRLREEGPAHEVIARRVLDLTDQLSTLTNQHQEAQAAAAYNSSMTALVPTMSASASPYASISGQRRRSRLCCPRPSLFHRRLHRGATHHHRSRSLRHSCLRAWAVPAPCTPHLATGGLLILQPRTKGRLEGPSRLLSPAMVCAPSRTTRSLPLPPPSSTLRPCVLRVLV
jgi:hypothetical protein